MKPPVIGDDASSRNALPKALGRFRIEASLGGGSFGAVYRAFDPLVGEHVALKVLRPELSKNTEQMERLRREVVLARKVDHPGVCRIHDLHQDGETLFVVMELIEGETFDAVCARGALSPMRATRMIEGVCRALAAAHDVGVLHRDIKPSNVMVRPNDEVTLVDFGIATTQGLEHLTRPGVALGTVGYLAPELWEGDEATPASDVFAAGVVLYGALTSKMPWRAAGLALVQHMKSVAPVPPSMYAPAPAPESVHTIDDKLDAIVLKALSVRAPERYASARAFADALHAWRKSARAPVLPLSTSPLPDASGAGPRDTVPVPTSRASAALVAFAVTVVLALVAVVMVVRNQPAGGEGARAPNVAPPVPVVERKPLELTRRDPPPRDDEAPAAADDAHDELVAFEPSDVASPTRERPRPSIASTANELAPKLAAARSELARTMRERGLVVGDVPSADTALRSRVGGQRALTNLEAALVDVKAVNIDRAFVERKLARLQARAAGRAPDARLDTLAAGIAADIAARKYVEANVRLNRALAHVR